MSYKPEPIPFQGYSGDDHIPVDKEDQRKAAALQLQNNAYPGGPLGHRSNADEEGVAFGRRTSASMTLTGERTIEPLPVTIPSGIDRSRSTGTTLRSSRVIDPSLKTTRSDIEGCTEENKPLSCPDVDHDSESIVAVKPEHSDAGHLANPSEGNRVQKSSPTTTTRPTAGHASQACDSSDQPPISSSENAEEQGDAERDGTRKSKISSGGKASKRRKK